MKTTVILLAAGLACSASAQTNVASLTVEHTDIALVDTGHATNRLSIVAHDDNHNATYEHDQVILAVAPEARFELPAGTPFGDAGSPLWILPQSQYPGLLYLGFSTEALASATFPGPLAITLVNVDLPGRQGTSPRFYTWQAGQFGDFDVTMNSADGIDERDAIRLPAGAHAHYNFGFSTPGLWHVTLKASGAPSSASEPADGEEVAWAFHVLPLSPFEEWEAAHWPPGTPGSIIGPAADPDGDSSPNLVEYARGTDPAAANFDVWASFTWVSQAGSRHGGVRYLRARAATDAVCTVEAADAPAGAPWQTLTNEVETVEEGPFDSITVRDDTPWNGKSQRYYRIRVSLAAP